MNVLFLPLNIASMQPITAKALNEIEGISAKCIVDQNSSNAYSNNTVILIPRTSKKEKFKSIIYGFTYFNKIKKWIEWADVLHYVYVPGDKFFRDLNYAHKLGKKIVVEFVGSDIRVPEILININPYYKYSITNKLLEYIEVERNNGKFELQKLFAKNGAVPMVNPEMKLYINHDLFPRVIDFFVRIDISNILPIYPEKNKNTVRIVHSPSALNAKGSNYIIPILNKLNQKYNIEFVLNQNKTREDVLISIENADIVIDQIIIGSYGMAALEAMAYGKPTICYIMPSVFENGLPIECPIVNANPDTLEEKLVELIESPELRNKIGIKSRKFVEEYHSADKLAQDLVAIYKGL